MFGIIIKLFVIAVGVIIVVNFLPAGIKERTLALFSSIIPDVVEQKIQETIDPIIHTPAERREKLITELKKNISEIKTKLAENPKNQTLLAEEIIKKIEETEKVIEKIKDANEEQSTINKVTTSIVKKAAEILTPEDQSNPPATETPPYTIQPTTPAPAPSCKWICD